MSTQAITDKIADYFKTQPVVRAWLFGSFARGEEREDSDIDLIVRFDRENAKVGLFKYAAIVLDLEKLLNRHSSGYQCACKLPGEAYTRRSVC